MTTRGFGEAESRQVGHLIADLLDAPGDAARLSDVKARLGALTSRFPVYR
jgi:glycine hydroxymethyltransferase